MSDSREKISIDCSGPMTFADVETARECFRDAMNSGAGIEVDCSGTAEVSICLIQLILASHRSAMRRGIGFRVGQPVSAPLRDALERGGFIGTAGSRREGEEFWIGEP